MTAPDLAWTPVDPTGEYDGQRADLPGGYWAEVGPDVEGWSWTIRYPEAPFPAAEGWAATEAQAKADAAAWAQAAS